MTTMLCLAGLLLSWGALCLASPVPPAACTADSLIQETLHIIQNLTSKGSSEVALLNNVLEEGGNLTTYLEGFIEVLKSSKKRSKERLIAQNLQKIRDAVKSCPEWMEQDWEPEEEKDFFSNLAYLLRFLNHYAPSEETG